MARQSKNRGGGHAPVATAAAPGIGEFSLSLEPYGVVGATWNYGITVGSLVGLQGWIWVSRDGGPFVRVQSLAVETEWDGEDCPDIAAYLVGGGEPVQAYGEIRDAQGELVTRSAVFSGTYSPS